MVVIEGRRRRHWPEAVKRRIVEESEDPDVTVCEVARRHELGPGQLFSWRKTFRERDGRVPFRSEPLGFVPVEVAQPEALPGSSERPSDAAGARADRIEIVLAGGRRLSVPMSIDPKRLARLAKALEA
ncbi:IS66-like element accessory protein TnpA [Parvularcula oceani]|uniref:IS66-like element accessory protein TnpA n=1 Tax=Parvularcula oceani TaxID=1247963 RepID=UPI00138E0374|nr:transposase [Parvularcula oceani]